MSAGRRSVTSRIRVLSRPDLICVLLLLTTTLGLYAPSLFGGKVLLPADIVPLMRPWAIQGVHRLPNPYYAQNQLHGPIFEYYPWRYYARERLRAGEVPLWNPYELGGNVLLANSQSAVLYPPNLLLYLLPLHTGINLVTALHTFLTGLFLYGLMRLHRLDPIPALTAAWIWMFCGVQMAWLEFQTPTATLCWLPGLLLAWEAYAGRGRVRAGLVGGAAGVGLTLLAGHLHFAFYVLLAFGLYAVGRTIYPAVKQRLWGKVRTGMLVLIGALVLGTGLSAVTLVPVVEMAGHNFRAGKTEYASSIGLKMPPMHLLTLVQPNLFGSPRDYILIDEQGQKKDGYPYWGAFSYIEFACYLGIAGLVLAFVGARSIRVADNQELEHRFAARWLLGLALLGLLLALGTPLAAIFFYGVPGYGQFNATGRAICLFCFGMAGLAGLGLQALISRPDSQKVAFGLGLGTVVLAGLIAFPGLALVHRKMLDNHWLPYYAIGTRHFIIFTVLAGLAGWMLIEKSSPRFRRLRGIAPALFPAIALIDLLLIFGRFNPQSEAWMLGYPTVTSDFLQQASPGRIVSLAAPEIGARGFIVPNYNAVLGLREAQGADSLHSRRLHKLLERVVLEMEPGRGAAFDDPNTIHFPAVSHRLFDLLNVRYVTTLPDRSNPDVTRLEKALDAELTLWRNREAMGPAWIVGAAEKTAALEETVARLGDPAFDPKKTALLETTPPSLDASAAGSPVALTDFQPHRLTLECEANGRGLVVLSEIAHPGWRARIDGREAPILTANYILRSVPVEQGRHRIDLEYAPTSYRLGLFLTCFAAGALSTLFFLSRSSR